MPEPTFPPNSNPPPPPLPAPLQGERRPLSPSVLALELPHQGWERPAASDEETKALDPPFLEALLGQEGIGR